MKNKKNRTEALLNFDTEFRREFNVIAGVDEAGRGAIAGPVCAAAVILNFNHPIIELIDDSKTLTAKEREVAYKYLEKQSISFAFKFIDNYVIDKINILQATMQAMEKAVSSLKVKPDLLLIDGNHYSSNSISYRTIIDGDAKSLSIASASILAKVQRDRYMVEVADKLYPEYGFSSNKGYGTRKHFEAILKYGPSPIHRKTFLKKLYNQNISTLF